MKMIAAVSKDWGIGKDNDLLFSIPQDMKFFRETTKGATVVMGRKTLDSFPNGAALKNRVNIVVTRDKDFERENVLVCHSKEEVLKLVEGNDYVFIIGGEAIYNMFLENCDLAYITKVDSHKDSDKFFPNLDELSDWELSEISEEIEDNGYSLNFCTYKRK